MLIWRGGGRRGRGEGVGPGGKKALLFITKKADRRSWFSNQSQSGRRSRNNNENRREARRKRER